MKWSSFPSLSSQFFWLNLNYEMIKLVLAKRHVVTVELKMMKMTDCNTMLAVSAKTLITKLTNSVLDLNEGRHSL